ncbi:MAG: Holliday junction branch migration protein RuvA [Candidatus Dojkabacteria bacterium]|nr:MAG: Holliday junction branch migration protein RuvA [Candidatus Dojkabacteria bacterium]
MIGFIRGTLLQSFPSGKKSFTVTLWPYESLSQNGLGYSVYISAHTAAKLTPGEVVELWTHQVSTDQESYVIGVESQRKLMLFFKLISVSGVGPKSALQIIDELGSDGLLEAVQEKNVTTISKVPGIGTKTAQKIILELSGALVMEQEGTGYMGQIQQMLLSLGYKDKEAIDIMNKSRDELEEAAKTTTDAGELLRIVLRKLTK